MIQQSTEPEIIQPVKPVKKTKGRNRIRITDKKQKIDAIRKEIQEEKAAGKRRRGRPEGIKQDTQVLIKITHTLHENIKVAAELNGVSVTAYIRQALIRATQNDLRG